MGNNTPCNLGEADTHLQLTCPRGERSPKALTRIKIMKFYLLSICISQPLAIATDFTFNNNFATMIASCLTTIATAYIYTKFKK